MHFSTIFLSLLVTTSSAIQINVDKRGNWFTDSQAVIQDDSLKVPGENPLYFCSKPDDDILQIKKVDLDPNPPKAGKTLSIKASGNLTEEIEEGAKIHVQVKYGLITLINQEYKLCDQVGEIDLECPLEKGDLTLSKEVDLPKEIPPGKFTVLADVFTKDGDKITCLTATITFPRG
ncbi:Phosphatidylglycerol/phosphatidylinositol transfer protein [Patellaria atrata CBS 101060]|uniref:Phosphatidylglycerol/phosphatidylinositol transfer protein n=1 Tax=Patellaria atrata CBS 101060 TaxID=1346257 RepID=A0A9P4S319_9PEZI|nr:Phosphatidylglycerol/phosphatidylinositol transfer protein [Patellaria atrata CBS 101060]